MQNGITCIVLKSDIIGYIYTPHPITSITPVRPIKSYAATPSAVVRAAATPTTAVRTLPTVTPTN